MKGTMDQPPVSPALPGGEVPAGAPRGGDERFLSEAACQALAQRVAGMAVGGGHTQTMLESAWASRSRWARNRINTGGDVRETQVTLQRNIRGAEASVALNMLDDAALDAAMRKVERLVQTAAETTWSAWEVEYTEQYLRPVIWSEATYHLEAEAQAEVVQRLIRSVEQAGLVAAGYLEVAAHGRAIMNTRGRAMYYPYTEAQYSVTVRNPEGTGSGWAGVSHWDWGKIDTQAITQRAVEKCLQSRNPVALEPGRYTTVLEPQATYQLFAGYMGANGSNERPEFEANAKPPFGKGGDNTRIGEVVMDERVTLEVDPMDPDLGHVPFLWNGNLQRLEVYHAAQWVHKGVLVNLPYDQEYAMHHLGKNTGLLSFGAIRLRSSAPPVSLEDMIASTTRGLLVSHFTGSSGWLLDASGYTRDGVWLIEQGKIAKPVKNFLFRENPFSLLQSSRLEAIGAPVRVFSPGVPAMMPPVKVKDFNFTQLADAI